MSDWADKIGDAIAEDYCAMVASPIIAAALRKAREDALEEAARACETKSGLQDGFDAAAAIRNLKEKT